MDVAAAFENCNNSKRTEIWQMWNILPVPSKHKSRTSELCRCWHLRHHCSVRSHCCWKLMLPNILSTEHWPFRRFESIGFENGPTKGAASPSAFQGLWCASFHPHGFCEAVALAASGQPSCILTECQDPLTCTPACTQSPCLPSFVQAPGVTLELVLETLSASEKWKQYHCSIWQTPWREVKAQWLETLTVLWWGRLQKSLYKKSNHGKITKVSSQGLG